MNIKSINTALGKCVFCWDVEAYHSDVFKLNLYDEVVHFGGPAILDVIDEVVNCLICMLDIPIGLISVEDRFGNKHRILGVSKRVGSLIAQEVVC